MVLKKSPKRYQMIWFTEQEETRLKSFVSETVAAEVAMNSACTEIVNMVLENDDLRRLAKRRLDEKFSKELINELSCKWCGFRAGNLKGAAIHAESCKKRPLEVLVR